ncbi:MAG: hypothetical protein OXR71_05650 [Gemmatimonadota bacterium]|nr:hypothetical protein [Gemmatimonadota bacterium]
MTIPGVFNVEQNAECCKRIVSVVMGFDGWTSGCSVRELGIEGMDLDGLNAFLETGL